MGSGAVVGVIPLKLPDGTTVEVPRFFHYILRGYGYIATKRFEGLADDSSVDVYIENPLGSGRLVYCVLVEISGFGNAYVDVYYGVSVTSSGNDLIAMKMNKKGKDPIKIIEYGGTYDISGAEKVCETVLPGGTKKEAIGGAISFGEAVLVSENENYLIRITNKSGVANDFSVKSVWWEEPGG